MTRTGIKLVLFDLDGVLVDSLVAKWGATEHALKSHGVESNREAMAPHMHKLRAIQENLASHVAYDSMYKSYLEKLDELRPTIEAFAASRPVLEKLRALGLKLGVVSSSETANETLEDIGLGDLFDVVVSGLDTNTYKPHPEPVLQALKKLDIPANHAAMVGDLPADILAGKTASLPLNIGITHGFGTKKMLEDAGADAVIDKLEALEDLLKDDHES